VNQRKKRKEKKRKEERRRKELLSRKEKGQTPQHKNRNRTCEKIN